MRTVIRAAIVGAFLFTLHTAKAEALNPCGEYMCQIPIGFGGGYYCIQEGSFDCICNMFSCMCGDCECDDNGDCYIIPSQG
jgi:hypothetical protein